MAKKPKTPVPINTVPRVLPPVKASARPLTIDPLLSNKKITKKGLVGFLQKVTAAYAPHLYPQLLESVMRGAIRDDASMVKIGFEVLGVGSKGGGITINNVQSNQNTASASTYSKSFDAAIRKMSEGRVVDVSPEE